MVLACNSSVSPTHFYCFATSPLVQILPACGSTIDATLIACLYLGASIPSTCFTLVLKLRLTRPCGVVGSLSGGVYIMVATGCQKGMIR